MYQSITTNIMVKNIKETIKFYEEKLGFQKVLSVPEEGEILNFAIIAKDNKISQLQIFKKNCISFISKLGLAERFNEFISPKSVKKELKKKQEQVNKQKQDKLFYSQEKHHKREQAEI